MQDVQNENGMFRFDKRDRVWVCSRVTRQGRKSGYLPNQVVRKSEAGVLFVQARACGAQNADLGIADPPAPKVRKTPKAKAGRRKQSKSNLFDDGTFIFVL